MKKFEYKTLKFDISGGFFSVGGKVDIVQLDKQLAELGELGWELVNTFDTAMYQGSSRELILIFKKEKEVSKS
ncbi:MAG: DUF4177 domain-containing protein [Bacteroidota bacterium]